MNGIAPRFARCRSGSTAAEFALVFPLLIFFLFGIIDAGRAMWTWNRAEKATEMGVRHAVATNPVPAGLASYSFVTDGGLQQGSPIGQSDFAGVSCTWPTGQAAPVCTCKGASCPWLTSTAGDATAFNYVVERMQMIMGEIGTSNVQIDYDWSGLGYAGDPNGPDISPLITVRVVSLQFQPVTLSVFGGLISVPESRSALTMEDGQFCISAYYEPGVSCT